MLQGNLIGQNKNEIYVCAIQILLQKKDINKSLTDLYLFTLQHSLNFYSALPQDKC